MKVCKKHISFLGGFTTCDLNEYKCSKCKTTFYSSSLPSRKVCVNCSDKYNLCIYCGENIDASNEKAVNTNSNKELKNDETKT